MVLFGGFVPVLKVTVGVPTLGSGAFWIWVTCLGLFTLGSAVCGCVSILMRWIGEYFFKAFQ
jgi:hypothetical protein